ncbi:MAG: hypothetical protein Q8M58_07955 [Anaerolineales bacterium]|nr:hypothetical protein [Anaerolineales bacterium]
MSGACHLYVFRVGLRQIHPPALVELHALGFEQGALFLRTRAQADLALSIDDALPGYVRRTGGHRPAHLACFKGQVIGQGHPARRRDQGCNLPIGGNLARRYLADDIPDQGVKSGGIGMRSEAGDFMPPMSIFAFSPLPRAPSNPTAAA